MATGQGPVTEESSHLYGEQYWDEHMRQYGYPPLNERAIGDLTDRAQYWLSYLLKYCTPPARALELGCAHGGFVKLMAAAGFEASGMEMSPGIIAKAREWFGVDVIRGPIEHAERPVGEFDVVLLFDVIEHFADPVSTVGEIIKHVAPSGMLVFQTPNYDDVGTAEWHQFKSPEHTFLFSSRGLQEFLRRLGFSMFALEPPIFGGDMFVFASRVPFRLNDQKSIADRLVVTPDGRLVLAMQELYSEIRRLRDPGLASQFGVAALASGLARATGRAIARRLKG